MIGDTINPGAYVRSTKCDEQRKSCPGVIEREVNTQFKKTWKV